MLALADPGETPGMSIGNNQQAIHIEPHASFAGDGSDVGPLVGSVPIRSPNGNERAVVASANRERNPPVDAEIMNSHELPLSAEIEESRVRSELLPLHPAFHGGRRQPVEDV